MLRFWLWLSVILLSLNCFATINPSDYIRPDREQVVVLDDHLQALYARTDLIETAREEVFVAYYYYQNDTDGFLVLFQLLQAARRGVKVKLLVDDLFNRIPKEYLAALIETGNARIHTYNTLDPIKLYANTYRMHDKLVIIDKKYLILGGRNMVNAHFGHENKKLDIIREGDIYRALFSAFTGFSVFDIINYFYSRALANYNNNRTYVDRDALVTGSAVQVAREYYLRRFYHDKRVTPTHLGRHSVEREDIYAHREFLQCLETETSESTCISKKARKIGENFEKLCNEMGGGSRNCKMKALRVRGEVRKAQQTLAASRTDLNAVVSDMQVRLAKLSEQSVVVDEIAFLHKLTPNTSWERAAQEGMHISASILKSMAAAQNRMWYETPYLVPTEELYGVAQAVHANNPNFDFKLLTNSLLTTDVPIAHAGYSIHRDDMAKEGMKLYEFESRDMWHSKTGVFDDDLSFIGSYNLDPRSQNLNSEVGVLIRSHKINEILTAEMRWRFEHSVEVDTEGHRLREFNMDYPFWRKIDYFFKKAIVYIIRPIETQL